MSRRREDAQANEREGEQCLVYPAHHDPSVFVPVLDIAHIGQRAAHVPREETPAKCPQEGEEAVDGNVETRVQTNAAVQYDCERERGDRKERGCCKLLFMSVETWKTLCKAVAYPDERPRRLPVVVRQMPNEEAHDRAHDQAGHELEEADAMEGDARVVRGRRFGLAVEWVQHLCDVVEGRKWLGTGADVGEGKL